MGIPQPSGTPLWAGTALGRGLVPDWVPLAVWLQASFFSSWSSAVLIGNEATTLSVLEDPCEDEMSQTRHLWVFKRFARDRRDGSGSEVLTMKA